MTAMQKTWPRCYTDRGYDSPLWKLRLASGGGYESLTRRKWVRWRRFINRFRRANQNHPDLHRDDAWGAFCRSRRSENLL